MLMLCHNNENHFDTKAGQFYKLEIINEMKQLYEMCAETSN